jgi:L-alanine-DL-glutamate epimerase-like enolase superfamily enzyme
LTASGLAVWSRILAAIRRRIVRGANGVTARSHSTRRRPAWITDEGLEGYCIAISNAEEQAQALERHLKPAVIGADVADRERLWQRLWDMGRGTLSLQPAQAVFDVAMWDLAAKRAKLPLYEYIGAYRRRIPAYASTFTQNSVDEYRRLVRDCVQRNYKAIKLHLFGDVREDIEACRAVRDEVGPDIALMIDASAAYTYDEALWAGRELERLGFLWFEEPLRDYQMHALSQLRAKLDIPLCVNETGRDNVFDVANNILLNTGSIMHAGWQRKSGITGLLKIAHVCEAFGLKCQLHRGEIPNLHVALAISNCSYFESIVPEDSFHFCLKTPPIVPDADGCVTPPPGPGLGYDIDWAEVEARTVRVV